MNDGPILLIEDNPDDRELTLRALARFCADLSVIALKDCSEVSELLEEPTASGIRSLEACLFMGGYDCASING